MRKQSESKSEEKSRVQTEIRPALGSLDRTSIRFVSANRLNSDLVGIIACMVPSEH